jgi:sensitive to high expression protein 9, mitochondrial
MPTSEPAPETPASTSPTLPSHAENKRWQLSKDVATFIDSLLARASIASQHINAYTGTDYSGIEALRREIEDQEHRVRTHHSEVDTAKAAHHEAYLKQAAAQKEIVSLLERKNNWSSSDLERYMELVRSEHLHDQAVSAAKENLDAAERQLEEARSLLERLERKQYHEEQIWSDTIRRNSTWVTFGLMGVNIVLLLAQIMVFEPWRRRKIVRDVKEALEGRTISAVGEERTVGKGASTEEAVEEPAAVSSEKGREQQQPLHTLLLATEKAEAPEAGIAGTKSLAAGEILPDETTDISNAATAVVEEALPKSEPPASTWDSYQAACWDLFSERLIQIKKVELTTAVLQGAAAGVATGVAVAGVVLLALRPK